MNPTLPTVKICRIIVSALFILILSSSLPSHKAYAQLSVQGGFTAAQLVDTLLGAGVTVSNITYNGAGISAGIFNGTSSNIGLGAGVLLCSGDIANAPGPNISGSITTMNNTPGDPDLTVLSGGVTNDAAILEFDFTVPTDTIRFRYVFGSDEYQEYVCSQFNDIFAFFISGPGIVGTQNLALIPGTTNPVSVNNVNGGVSAGTNPCILTNTAYFVDNENPPGATVEYDGFTVVLEAVSAVIPCNTYHIKLAIADASDFSFDSGVFLEQGSFSGVSTTAAATANPPIACAPATINFTNNSIGGSLYAWNFDDGSPIDSSQNPSHIFLNPGVYNVQLIATGALACGGISDTAYVTVTVTTNVPVNLGPDTSVCAGTSIVLGYGIVPGSGYLWSTGDTTSYLVVSTPGTYTVTVSSLQCPPGTDTINVSLTTVNVDLGNDTTVCLGQTVTLTSNITGSHYQWSNGATTASITVSTPGNYWLVVTANGCQGVDTVEVFFGNAANVNLGNDTTICPGQPIILGNNLSGTSFLWSTGETTATITVSQPGTYWVLAGPSTCQGSDTIEVFLGQPVSINIGNDTTLCSGNVLVLDAGIHQSYLWSNGSTTSTVNITTSGTYYVNVNDGGCLGTDSINVQFTPLPVINLGSNVSFCIGLTDTLDAGNAGATYLWSNGNTTQTIVVNSSGTYTVTVTSADCSASGSVLVTVNPLPVIILTNDTAICTGSSVNLNASGGTGYSWTPGNGLSNTSIFNPVANPTATTTYTVTVTDANSCSDSKAVTITVNALPSIVTISDTILCEGNSVSLTTQGGVSYSWAPATDLDNPNSSNPIASPGIPTLYTVTGTDANGCQNTDNVNIGITIAPVAFFTAEFTISCDGTQGVFTNTSTDASHYLWDFGDATTSTDMNPVHNFSFGSLNSVTLTAYNSGCSNEFTIQNLSTVTLETVVPNVFTPNGDQHNNCFGLDSLNGFENCYSIEIFGRWGNSVFKSDNAHECWDGTTGGKEAPAGTYFYLLKIAETDFKGAVQLIR